MGQECGSVDLHGGGVGVGGLGTHGDVPVTGLGVPANKYKLGTFC